MIIPRDAPIRLHLHLISDSTGETLDSVAKAGLAQFEGVDALKHYWPMVRASGHLDRVLDRGIAAAGAGALYAGGGTAA